MDLASATSASVSDAPLRGLVAGVDIEALGVPHELAGSLRFAAAGGGDCIDHLICSIRCDSPTEIGAEERRARWAWEAESCDVRYLGSRALIRMIGPRRYAATVDLRGGPLELEGVMSALAVAVVSRRGGVVLHAAGVELDGRAVLFVGPSGAGKTTACRALTSARGFVRDRVVLVPARTGWEAWSLPGWAPIDQGLPSTTSQRLPVAAVCGVRKGTDATGVRTLRPVHAVARLRESVMAGERTTRAERDLLETLESLARDVPIGLLTTVLGEPADEALRAWLAGMPR